MAEDDPRYLCPTCHVRWIGHAPCWMCGETGTQTMGQALPGAAIYRDGEFR